MRPRTAGGVARGSIHPTTCTCFQHFLDRLRVTPDGDGDAHDHAPLPVLVAGGAGGRLAGGRPVRYAEDTPLANLLCSVLEKVDVEVDGVGNNNGRLADL